MKKKTWEEIKKEILRKDHARIIRWAEEYIERDKRICGTDKHGIALADLIREINK